jgi:hypothetical protein
MRQLHRDEIEALEIRTLPVQEQHDFSGKTYKLLRDSATGEFYIYVVVVCSVFKDGEPKSRQRECFRLEAAEVNNWKQLVEEEIDRQIKPAQGEKLMNIVKDNMIDISYDVPIYRVFKVERFLEMFKNNEMVLLKPKKWDDPYENFLLNAQGKTCDGIDVSFEEMRERFYGSCWTTEKESDAMWRIYAPDKNGVKVKTSVEKLFNQFWSENADKCPGLSCFIGKVTYFPETEIESILGGEEVSEEFFNNPTKSYFNQVKTLLIKREAFSHEKEVRLIFRNSNPRKEKYGEHEFLWNMALDVYQFKIDPFELFDEIVFDPRMNQCCYKCFLNKLVTLGFDKNKISQSSLYKAPKRKPILR